MMSTGEYETTEHPREGIEEKGWRPTPPPSAEDKPPAGPPPQNPPTTSPEPSQSDAAD